MKALVDTQSVLWAVDDPDRLGIVAIATLIDGANELFISAGTLWEIAIKVGLGKLTLSMPYRPWMTRALADLDATVLPITVEHAEIQSGLSSHHRDPFDRLLIAQAIVEDMVIISSDKTFDRYGVRRH